MQRTSQFVGLDVHKDSIVMAVAPGGPGMEVKDLGSMAHDLPTLLKRLRPLGEPGQVHIAYEAGPTGFGLWRALRAAGYSCVVVAPPRRRRRAATASRPTSEMPRSSRVSCAPASSCRSLRPNAMPRRCATCCVPATTPSSRKGPRVNNSVCHRPSLRGRRT